MPLRSLALTLALLAPQAALAQTPAPSPAPSAAAAAPADVAPAAAPGANAPVVVPGGTPMKIALAEQLASNTAHTGDRFSFRSLEDVSVDGWVIVPKGALGEGQILQAESAGGNGHPGKLQLQFDWIYGADNLKIRLSDAPATSDGDAAKSATAV